VLAVSVLGVVAAPARWCDRQWFFEDAAVSNWTLLTRDVPYNCANVAGCVRAGALNTLALAVPAVTPVR